MAKVDVELEYCELESDRPGQFLPGIEATCTLCDHKTQSYGQTDRSVRRCLALMRDECPRNEDNRYCHPDAYPD